ncbi:MAG TPA: substrate-binding domain-containing protein [Vicinamibacteria bacterium]|nr:substrate-binding domain-containing protein [Vicinamibacteria bacterium]
MTQPFWIALSVASLGLVMSLGTDSFATSENLFNVTRNFAFIGLVALGQTAVILSGGIDLSVGSVMGLAGIVAGLALEAGQPLWLGAGAGMAAALACGATNGLLVAYLRLPPFVVTLGMLAAARSLALVVSNNRMVHDFGPDEALFLELGGGESLGLAHPLWLLLALALGFGFVLRATRFGLHLQAVGGAPEAARRAGIPVRRIALAAYLVSSGSAGLAAILMVGWLGAVTNALGQNYELRVIAAAVIGGANLAGGAGGAFGAVVGAALIEVIRNSLLLAGVDPYWQGSFVGAFIVLAVLLHRVRAGQVLVLLLLVACGPADSRSTFALVPKAMNNPFFDQARDGCKAAERELPDVECLYVGPGEHDEQAQVEIVQDLVTRRVDGIAVAPSNAPAIARALVRAREARIPVLTWDSDLLPEDRDLRAAYVGTRNREIGVAQAELLLRWKPDGGTLCIQSGGPAATNHNERIQGIRDTLAGHGWTEAAGCPLYSNDDFPLAVVQLEEVLAKYPHLDAFVATGGFPQYVDSAYRRVVQQHLERIRSRATLIVVADTLPVQMALLREGLSHAQVGQRPFEMGRLAIHLLRDLRDGRPVPDPVLTGIDVRLAEGAQE